EDRYPHLGRQARSWVSDAPLAQRVGERRRQRGQLDQLALLELRTRRDDGLTLPGEVAALLEYVARGLEGCRDGGDWGGGVGRVGDCVHEELLQCAGAPEENLALVGEMPEKRSLGQSGTLSDLGDGRVL